MGPEIIIDIPACGCGKSAVLYGQHFGLCPRVDHTDEQRLLAAMAARRRGHPNQGDQERHS